MTNEEYKDVTAAALLLWIQNFVQDAEYRHIIDRINAKYEKEVLGKHEDIKNS